MSELHLILLLSPRILQSPNPKVHLPFSSFCDFYRTFLHTNASISKDFNCKILVLDPIWLSPGDTTVGRGSQEAFFQSTIGSSALRQTPSALETQTIWLCHLLCLLDTTDLLVIHWYLVQRRPLFISTRTHTFFWDNSDSPAPATQS